MKLMKLTLVRFGMAALGGIFAHVIPSSAQSYVQLTEVPDYSWYAGCFGTASGNLMGYWDRHGMDGFYTGPTGGGLAPLDTATVANKGIRSMWASKAGVDGRPLDQPGHIDDYWGYYRTDSDYSYESTAPDPYVTAGRPEHSPDCVGDFIGLSQKKWTNLMDECQGNIDAYSFVFWDKTGQRRNNYSFTNATGQYIPDIQSGLRAWARYRGYEADVFTQLTSFNPERTGPGGFTYADVKAEIDAGYPVLCFLQPEGSYSRTLNDPIPMSRANPFIHGVVIYGYIDVPSIVTESVLIRRGWGDGSEGIQPWEQSSWLGFAPVRGVIGFRPRPKITRITRSEGNLNISWDGPTSQLQNILTGGPPRAVHRYQLEQSTDLNRFEAVGEPTTTRTMTVPACCGEAVFYRIKLLSQ
jgi:hypothetical protein